MFPKIRFVGLTPRDYLDYEIVSICRLDQLKELNTLDSFGHENASIVAEIDVNAPLCSSIPNDDLPLWGVQPCAFYLQNGYCKFGRTCKFDHPMGTVRYSPSTSSLTDMSVALYMVGPSLATMAPSFSYSELRHEFISGSNPHSSRMPSSGNTSSSSVGLIFSQTGSASLSDVQLSSQSTAPLSISTISTRQGGEVRRTS